MPNSIALNQGFPGIAKSDEYYERAVDLIPAATQTLAKGPGQYVMGVAPKYAARGKGSHVWDVDGNEYIDFTMGVGPVSLGYCYESVDEAIKAQLEAGITFSLMHPLEVEVAELIREIVPQAEMVRFSKTGCDVTSAAVRLARAYTNRNGVLCCGYHGWHDWYIGTTDRNDGVPEQVGRLTRTFNYNDLESVLEAIDGDTACVILEPMIFEFPTGGFLTSLRDVCETNGTLLIFDEMWTGFRLALGGAQQFFSVSADLVCYSKAIANGMPISVLAGRRDVMELCEKDVFFFTTFGGETLSLAAAKVTITELREKRVPDYLERQGKKLRDGYNEIAAELGMGYTSCTGPGCRTIVAFNAQAGNQLELKSLLQQEMIKRGVLWSGFHNMCFSHTDRDISYTLEAYSQALPLLRRAVHERSIRRYLRGDPVEPVFRRIGNPNFSPKRKALDAVTSG